MTKALALLAVIGVAGAAVVSADSSGAQMTVSVTVVRSCIVDARPAEPEIPQLRLTCTAGAQSNLRVAETTPAPSATVTSVGDRVLTLNF